MEWDEFKRLIGKICRYWERKIPTEEQGLEWFEMIKWIPEGNGDRIFEKFSRMESRPVNIPMRIQEVAKSFQTSPDRRADFLISLVMRHAEQYRITHIEAFYDLRGAIKNHQVNIGAAIRWLRSEGYEVDVKKLNEPSVINFGQLKVWLDNPGRLKRNKADEKPESFGAVLNYQDEMSYGRASGDEDIPF